MSTDRAVQLDGDADNLTSKTDFLTTEWLLVGSHFGCPCERGYRPRHLESLSQNF